MITKDDQRDTHLHILDELSDNQDLVIELKYLARLRHNRKAANLANRIQNDIDSLYRELHGGEVEEVIGDDDFV
jgi:uncharacterized protein with PhoU and TrkA domain